MEEILKNNFEVAYKEYKEYESYFKSAAPKIKEEREQYVKFAEKHKDDLDTLADKLFEIQSVVGLKENDLIKLQVRLITVYEMVKDILEIPADIKKEIEAFVKPKQYYKIEQGEAIEIDPELSRRVKEEGKKYYHQILSASK